MVCKEELCSWFRDLSPHKRIDYLCGMLHICLPLELRFVGSYVEDLAKKDFVHLREHEGKANSREELSKFSEIEAKSFRTKMAIYLALLRSSNRTCSSIIYQLLENNIKHALTVMDNMDEMTVHNILLVLSMAMNHPAFSYHQKMKMFEYYNMANQAVGHLYREPQVQHRESELLIPSLILSESCETRACDQRNSPAVSPQQVSYHSSQPTLSTNPKVYVTQIDVIGSRQRELEKGKTEYELQVTWSNGEKKEVFKTYQEIVDFQTKLKQKFPDESSLHLQNQVSGQKNHKGDTADQLHLMAKSFTNLPPHIKHCCLFSTFFDDILHPSVQMTDAATSPRLQNGLELSMVPTHSNNIGDINSLSPHSPAHIELGCNGSAHSPSCSTKTTSPLISSPSCQSPDSSVESDSRPSSPSPLDTEPNSITNHLRSHDLSAYKHILDKYSIEQLQQMRDEEIEGLGLSKDAVVILKTSIEETVRLRKLKGPHIPNGLVEAPVPTVFMYPPPPHTFIPPPNMQNHGPFHHPLHPPFYPNHYGFHHFPNPLVAGVQEMSPTNSEYSSPSQSSHLPVGGNRLPANVPVTDSSSDDSERDKHTSHHQAKPSSKWKGHPMANSRPNPADQGRDDRARQENNKNRETPPFNSDHPGMNAKPVYHSGSGYTSDPTYNAPRPQMVRPQVYSKALPAHTSIAIPPKYIINMPENNFKGGPMSIPQHLRDVTMTTGANLHGYGMISSDPSQRPIFPVVCGHPAAVLSRSHLNYVPKQQVVPPGLLQSAQGQPHAGPHVNVSGNNNGGKVLAGAPGLVLPIPPPVTLTQNIQQTSQANINSTEPGSTRAHTPSNNDSGTSSNVRASVIPVSTTTTSSTSMSQSAAGPSHPTSHCAQQQTSRSGCTSCGCPGHNNSSTTPTPINYMPHIQQNIWPFPNGVIPFQGMYMPHGQYINGVNHEHLYNHAYPLVNHGSQGAGGNVPNFVYGYNFYNSNHNPSNANSSGGYSKKVKKTFCSNCGSNKHLAVDCTETTMEAMSGHIKYSYKNDSD